MKDDENNFISQDVTFLHERVLPESGGYLAGYAALIHAYDLQVPLPEKLSYISSRYKRYTQNEWEIYTPRYKPVDSIAGHVEFAMKYEGIDLAILHALFQKIRPGEIEEWVKREPTGKFSRKTWFLYEWLTGKELALENVSTGNFIEVIDPKLQFAGSTSLSRRHRVNNNLPGTRDFCPLVRRTEKLKSFINLSLSKQAYEKTGEIHPDVLARAAAFLLLKDSRASFAIEGEQGAKGRAERWSRAIGQAGLHPLTTDELLRLQKIVIEDTRFVKLGFRTEGGFIGVHERLSATPIPDHISARWQDVPKLINGLIQTYNELNKKDIIDPIIIAAVIAFGFVFIHPFTDGNGRIHRYLIHHILSALGFTPKGVVFPVSAVILDRLDEYRQVLESYSRPRLDYIEWRPTSEGNVEVLNQTIDLYRYFDATRMTEFLYECVFETVENVLPGEIRYLERYERMKEGINSLFDMPDPLVDLLILFLQQNEGKLSKRARQKEFKALTEHECEQIENLYLSVFSA